MAGSMAKVRNAGRRRFGRNPKGRPLRGRIAASWAPSVLRVRSVAHSLRCARAGAVATIQKGTTRSGLGEFGIAPYDVRIILNEVTPENWGLRGGVPGSEINVGFKVNV
jgi:hypothetical protein